MVHAAGNEAGKFLRIDEAARLYPIGGGRLRRLVKAGEIPVINLDGRYLVRPEQVEAWLEKQEAALTVAPAEGE